MRPLTESDFWNRKRITESGCWEWTGATEKTRKASYGQLSFNGKHYRAHKLAFILKNGQVPNGKFVLHKCTNSLCINPDHLYAGTHLQNMADARMFGKWKNSKHQKTIQARIAYAEQVKRENKTIIELRQRGIPVAHIARKIGCSFRTVYNVLSGNRRVKQNSKTTIPTDQYMTYRGASPQALDTSRKGA